MLGAGGLIMRDLKAALRMLADAGNFSHLSILSTTCRGTDGSTQQGFCASFSPAAEWGRGHSEVHADPVVAALEAIERAPKGKRKEAAKPTTTTTTTTTTKEVHPPAEVRTANQAAGQSFPGEARAPQTDVPRPSLMGLFTKEDNDD
jgi:hypothetical protein